MAEGTTIVEKLSNIAASKAAIIASLKNKGITVPDGTALAELSALVDGIELGVNPDEYRVAFEADRTSMTSLTIPTGITKIGTHAFYDAQKLTTVIIPSTVTRIGDYAFWNCKSLTKLSLWGNLSVGASAFQNCTALKSLTLGSKVQNVDFLAFASCTALEELFIWSHSPFNFHQQAFNGIPATCTIEFGAQVDQVKTSGGYPWCIPDGTSIKCQNGTIIVGQE